MNQLDLFLQQLKNFNIEFTSDPEPFTDYSQLPAQKALLACFPKNPNEIAKILKLANTHSIPVTTAGLGSGKSGGAIPSKQSVFMSLKHLNQVIELDLQNRVIVTQPGVLLKTIQNTVEAEGLFYPPDPASATICSIGGNVAENAGGPRALKYGVTGRYVVGLKGFYGDGSPFDLGGKLHKNVAGYDMISLLVGSEGSLAVITEITLKLLPLPKCRTLLLLESESFQQSCDALMHINQAGLNPSMAELFDDFCLQAVKNSGLDFLKKLEGRSFMIFECDDHHKDALDLQVKAFKHVLESKPLGRLYQFEGEAEQEKLRFLRREISESLTKCALAKASEDIVLPLTMMPQALVFLESLSSQHIHVLGYGHAGDGNIHVNLLQLDEEVNWENEKQILLEQIFDWVIQNKGSVTGEHGVGLTKKKFLSNMLGDAAVERLKALKTILDPNFILNPDKIFDIACGD